MITADKLLECHKVPNPAGKNDNTCCYHCHLSIVVDDVPFIRISEFSDHRSIEPKKFKDHEDQTWYMRIFFHKDCFALIAGDDYIFQDEEKK